MWTGLINIASFVLSQNSSMSLNREIVEMYEKYLRVIVIMFILGSVGTGVNAAEITVPGDFGSIQAAINAAETDDTIRVDGTGTAYRENILVNKTVILIGQDTGAGLPIIDGGIGKAVNITGESVSFSNFIIENASYGIFVSTNSTSIEHNQIDSSYGWGIYIKEARRNLVNDNILNTNEGIFLNNYAMNDAGHIIRNNTIVSDHKSIILYYSYNNTISNNSFTSGIDTGIMVSNAHGNNILDNLIFQGSYGIYLNGAYDGAVSRNTIRNSTYSGIYVNNSQNVIISDNLIADNDDDGIYLTRSSNTGIYRNTLSGNGNYGINIVGTGGSGNVIYLNDFINTKNAYTTYSNFQEWNFTAQTGYLHNGSYHAGYLGNYWSGYGGTDGDGDGIGDTPYAVTGLSKDYHPLIESQENYTLVPIEADLLTLLTSSPDPAYTGEPVRLTIRVINIGPFPAKNVIVLDDITGLLGGTIISTDPLPDIQTPENLTWTIPELEPGNVTNVTVVSRFSEPGMKYNNVTVSSDIIDPYPENNLYVDAVVIEQSQADILAIMSSSPDPAYTGEPVSWTIRIINTGPCTAINVIVLDDITGLLGGTIISTDPLPDIQTPENLTWTIPELEPGNVTNVTFVSRFGEPGMKYNNVTVSSAVSDPFPENNLYVDAIFVIEPSPTPLRRGHGGESEFTFTSGEGKILTSDEGKVLRTTYITSEDGIAQLTLPQHAFAHDSGGEPLQAITITPVHPGEVPEAPAEGIFTFGGYAYECLPSAATFDPSISLSFSLTENQWQALPAGKPSVLWWNSADNTWEALETTVHNGLWTVRTEATTFGIFGLFVRSEVPVPTVDGAVTMTRTVLPESGMEMPGTVDATPPVETSFLTFVPVSIIGALMIRLYKRR